MTTRTYLGLDLGSVSLDAVVIDETSAVLWSAYRPVRGRSRDAVVSLCGEFLDAWLRPGKVAALDGATATGSGKELVQELLGVPTVNEIVAHGTAASLFAGGSASVIEIGGQDSKFILVDDKGVYDYSMNELCAAGTGAFLDVQAERLGIGIEELSALAASATKVPPRQVQRVRQVGHRPPPAERSAGRPDRRRPVLRPGPQLRGNPDQGPRAREAGCLPGRRGPQ
jgi:activator of 2-hydroxyglutaryl-CoA dehydratase